MAQQVLAREMFAGNCHVQIGNRIKVEPDAPLREGLELLELLSAADIALYIFLWDESSFTTCWGQAGASPQLFCTQESLPAARPKPNRFCASGKFDFIWSHLISVAALGGRSSAAVARSWRSHIIGSVVMDPGA